MNNETLHKISYGLYVISSIKDGKINGQIANTAMQVSADPASLIISLNKLNLTHNYITTSGKFSVSILAETTPMELIGLFGFQSGRDINKFAETPYRTTTNGTPILLDNTIGYLSIDVNSTLDANTHTIFKGDIVEAELLNSYSPLTYSDYHNLKNGKTPPNAPISALEETPKKLNKYTCTICGYVFDPEEHGCTFEELPDDWTCPMCGARKDQFELT